MSSNIPAPILSKMRPLNMRAGEIGKYFETLEYMLEQIQGQTGLSQDELKGVPDVYGVIDPVSMLALEAIGVEFISTLAGYTTKGNEFVRVTSVGTTTLNATPDDLEVVTVQPIINGLNIVSGPINGGTSITITKAYDSITMKYFLDVDEWVIQ